MKGGRKKEVRVGKWEMDRGKAEKKAGKEEVKRERR